MEGCVENKTRRYAKRREEREDGKKREVGKMGRQCNG
jgi:hypothetical protein